MRLWILQDKKLREIKAARWLAREIILLICLSNLRLGSIKIPRSLTMSDLVIRFTEIPWEKENNASQGLPRNIILHLEYDISIWP